jgi:segregation and condensation protein A
MREAADWLAARRQLGQVVFGRGQSTPPQARPQAELLVAFLEATLTMLEGREGQATEAPPSYRPTPPDLWRIPDALRRIADLLGQHPTGLPLERCLPPVAPKAPDRPLRLRAALASTLVAGLELARDGTLSVEQAEPFGPISLGATVVHGSEDQTMRTSVHTTT